MSAFALAILLSCGASAASPRAQLKALTAQLQTAPSDDALRGRVIAMAKTLKPAPAIPEEARGAFVRGNTAFKDAKDGSGYTRAASRFEEASRLAPWWADPYFNQAKAEQAAGRYDAALRSMKHYLAAATKAAERRQGQDLVYELQEKLDGQKADAHAAANSAEAARARTEASIEGTWWALTEDGGTWDKPAFVVTREGDRFEMKFVVTEGFSLVDVQATETTLKYVYKAFRLVTVDLHRQGALLVGTSFINEYPQDVSQVRFTRK